VYQNKELYEWTDEIMEDDPDFQGLLEEEEEVAVHPDITVELPGVVMEDKMDDTAAVVEDDEPDFRDLAAITLNNAGINPQKQLGAAQTTAAALIPFPAGGPAIIDAKEDEIVYELTFDFPDTGLAKTMDQSLSP
jgi:hypothetical protein